MGLATDTGVSTGEPVNDCYGSKTATAGTAITRVIPPRTGARACLGNFKYVPAATAHTLTAMVTMAVTAVATDALSGATTVTLSSMPTAADGSILAANDWLVMQYEDGSWNPHLVSSVSGLVVTIGATTQKIKSGTKVFFMGAPGDHTDRQFLTIASTSYDFIAGDFRNRGATSRANGEPILFHSDNATAAGRLHHMSYFYD